MKYEKYTVEPEIVWNYEALGVEHNFYLKVP